MSSRSRSGNSSSSRRSSGAQYKKFTFKQIQEKVAERWEIPEYYDILMEAAVKEESDGIQFNLKHPSFQKLIKLVKEHDVKRKQKEHKTKSSKRPKGSGSTTKSKYGPNAVSSSPSHSHSHSHAQSQSHSHSNHSHSHSHSHSHNDSQSQNHNHHHRDTPKLRVLNRSRKSTKKVKSQQEWLDILTEQLSSHSPNAKVVRESCRHVGIPINLRATIWKILLNVPKKKAKLFQRQNKDYQSPHHRLKRRNPPKRKQNAPPPPPPPPHSAQDDAAHSHSHSQSQSHSSSSSLQQHDAIQSTSPPAESVNADTVTDSDDEESHSVPHQAVQPPHSHSLSHSHSQSQSQSHSQSQRYPSSLSDHSAVPPSVAHSESVPSDSVATNSSLPSSSSMATSSASRPSRQRFGVWDIDFEPLRDDPPPLYNQRVIQADIERTRPMMKCFQDSAVRQEMEIILTEYCHRKKVSYKQGMNYILSPFFMIAMKDRLDIYLCFESFIETFLNSTFNDEEFGSLQCIFRMFRLLMQYHDPMLSSFLDHHEIMPELFASGWFMTVHANKCDQATLLHVWDEILLENDAVFHYFVDLEILRRNREDILKRSQEELPQFLVNLVIEDRDYARRLLKDARKTLANTPASYHEMLTQCAMEQIVVDSVDYVRLEKLPCLSIEPKELIGHCYAEALLANANQNGDEYSIDALPKQSASNGADTKYAAKREKHSKRGQTANAKVSKTEMEQNDGAATVGHVDGHKKFKFNMKRKGVHKKDKSGSLSITNHLPSQPPPPVPDHAIPSPASASAMSGGDGGEEESANKKYGRKVRKLLKQSTKYAENKHIKFFILDCRSLEEYEAGHLPCAFWIDPTLEVSSEQLREKLKSLLEMKGCHFVLFFDGRHNSSDQLLLNNNDPLEMMRANDTVSSPEEYLNDQQLFRQSLLYFFLEKKCKYISICESGYAGCHELVVGNLELIDHVHDRCIECNGKWKNSLLSSVRGRFNAMISVAGGSMEKLRNRMIESRSQHQHHHHHPHKAVMGGSSAMSSRAHSMSHFVSSYKMANNFDGKEIEAEYAGNVHLCRNEPLLMMYLSILRDRDTKNVDRVQDVTHKILVLMFSQIFEYHFDGEHSAAMEIAFDYKECLSPLDITYGSLICQRGVYGVCLNDSCENALQNLLSSFQPVLRSVIGTLKVEESFVEDEDGILRSNRQAVALMPKDIDQRIVIIFHDSITQHNANNELQSAIDALLKLGAKEQNIIVIALIASRLATVGLVQKFGKLHIWCACIDAVNSQSGSKLIPGIGVFQHRYKFKKNKNKKTPSKRKRTRKGDAATADTRSPQKTANEKAENMDSGKQKEEASNEDVTKIKDDTDAQENGAGDDSKGVLNTDNNTNDSPKKEIRKEQTTASARSDSDDHCE